MIGSLRWACRQLLRSKGYFILAAALLALGIGANTAIFSLTYAIMFKALPVDEPERLVRLGDGDNCCNIGGFQDRMSIFSYPLYTYLRDNTPEFEQLSAFMAGVGQVGVRRPGTEVSESFVVSLVSGNYFPMLGMEPAAGRLLGPDDDLPNAPPAAVLSYGTWQHLGGDPAMIGSTLVVFGVPCTVVGVAPREFFGETLRPDPPDIWLPLAVEPAALKENALLPNPGNHWLYLMGRLKPGVEIGPLEARINTTVRQWFLENLPPKDEAEFQAFERQHVAVVPAGSGISTLKGQYERDLQLLQIITAIVLLIACANVANLQLARATAGAHQVAIRVALGAGRRQVLRQALSESLLLALAGGVASLAVAIGLTRLLIVLAFGAGSNVPIAAAPDLPVLGFAFLLSLLSAVAAGIAPAWLASGADPAAVLGRKGRSAGPVTTRLQRSLVLVQAALALTLLVAAGLTVQTVRNLRQQDFGFNLDGAFEVRVSAAFNGYPPERFASVYRSIEERLLQVPGVTEAALALYSPMSGINYQGPATLEDDPESTVFPSWVRVSPGFFRTIGARLLRGRTFDERDTPASPKVAVVNQAFADAYFPGEDPIGKRFGLGGFENRADYQIVGVVNNILFRYPRQPDVPPMFFLPLLQMRAADWADASRARSNVIRSIVLRVAGSPAGLEAPVRTALGGIDDNLTVLGVTSMAQLLDGQIEHELLIARLAQLLGIVALALAAIGLYGLTAYGVVRRAGEFGIRAALGATCGTIVRLVLKNVVLQTSAGLALGIPASLMAGRLLTEQLYQVNASDPWILGGAATVVLVSAVVAGLVPAIRAAAVDPVRALQQE